MKKNFTTKGYSLIEVLVAVAILMFSIVGPITIAVKSMQSAQYALQQNTAFFLAQEGISAVNTLRNEGALRHVLNGQPEWSWANESGWLASCFTSTGCGIDFRDESVLNNIVDCSANANACVLRFNDAGTRAKFSYAGGGVLSPYSRVITLTTLNGGNEVNVVSTVEWTSRLFGEPQMVTLTSSVFNIYK
jgi:Tfp pilus assembly protein PilV